MSKRSDFAFKICTKSKAFSLMRSGEISTPHGIIKTPAFIPVGTRAAIKGVTTDQMEQIGAQALLANAYHLRLRPGEEIIDCAGGEKEGGLAKFMNWKRDGIFAPTFTDSGGFQVMSLGVGFKKVVALTHEQAIKEEYNPQSKKDKLARIDDDGVTFKSHIDGQMLRFTPEISLSIQHKIGADIMFAFDELTTLQHSRSYQEDSLFERTHPWAIRSLRQHAIETLRRKDKPYQALYAVLQGANYEDLRRITAKFLAQAKISEFEFDGFGIGGALEKNQMSEIISWCSDELNNSGAEEKPRHLLGISGIDDIFAGCENGVDTFDCVSPSREARNGALYTKNGRINLKNSKFKTDFSPIEIDCECPTCKNYSKAYLHHLLKVGELLGYTLTTIHNEYFIIKLVDKIRTLIGNDEKYVKFKTDLLNNYYSKMAANI